MCRSCAILALAHSADSNEVAGHFRKPMKFRLNVVSNSQAQNWIYVPLMCSGSKIVMECLPKIQNFSSFRLHPSNKCAQIAKEWLDKGLAKCHEIAVLYPSSRNPPAWLGKIHGITFFTPTGTP